jgi:hypothetical protein
MTGRAQGGRRRWIDAAPIATIFAAAWLAIAATSAAFAPRVEERDVSPLSLRCGYDVDSALGQAFYTHCDERSKIVVYINYRSGMIGEACLGPGTHPLGTSDAVEFAYYAGRSC